MFLRLTIKEFGTKNLHIYGVDNIIADNIIRLSYETNDQDGPRYIRYQSRVGELFFE